MKQKRLQLQDVTSMNRHLRIGRIKDAITSGGGYILNFQMFSNVAICINFEVSVKRLGAFQAALKNEGILNDESIGRLADYLDPQQEVDGTAEDINGTLNVTFVHDEPDLRIKAPPIPGYARSIAYRRH